MVSKPTEEQSVILFIIIIGGAGLFFGLVYFIWGFYSPFESVFVSENGWITLYHQFWQAGSIEANIMGSILVIVSLFFSSVNIYVWRCEKLEPNNHSASS